METEIITGLDAYRKSDEEYDHLLGQLDHLQDTEVKQALEFKKLENQPDTHRILKDEAFAVTFMEWLLPGVVAVIILAAVGLCLYCFLCRFNGRRLKNEYQCAKKSACGHTEVLETIPAAVMQQTLRRGAPARPPQPETSLITTNC